MGQFHEAHELCKLKKWYIILILDKNITMYTLTWNVYEQFMMCNSRETRGKETTGET